MNDLLDASCVFNCLINQQNVLQLVDGKHWKNTSSLQCKPYRCSFFINKNNHNCIVSFQIIIYKNYHCVKLDSIESLLEGIEPKEVKHIHWVIEHCVL